jgi:hypothetical protein
MAKLARCAGCSAEGKLSLVVAHQRSCTEFARLCSEDLAMAMLDPFLVYQMAHADDEAPASRRARASKSAGTAVEAEVDPGSVSVEYWTWDPTLLETLAENH